MFLFDEQYLKKKYSKNIKKNLNLKDLKIKNIKKF